MVKTIKNYMRTTDKTLITICLMLSVLGVVLLFGIYTSEYAKSRQLLVQALSSTMGIVIAVGISFIDYRFIATLWKIYVPISMFLVSLTYFIGIQRFETVDDKAWLPIPFLPITFQPSEILKIALILSFALHLEKISDNINNPATLFWLCVHGAIPVFMVIAQGDDGSALVIAVIFCVMIFVAGISWVYIGMALGSVVLISPIVWFVMFNDDKRNRVLTVFNPELDPQGIGWQQSLGRLSIGSGQVWGRGIFAEDHNYVAEMHNDFIFAFTGEALGFVGCCTLLLLFSVMIGLILYNAKKAKDPLGRYICIGVFGTIAFQTVINIGMCLSLLPVIGVTLPLVSAGGTSVCMTYIGIGLVLSVYRYSNTTLFID